MKIAVDKTSTSVINKTNDEYIYLFDDSETIDELLTKNIRCVHNKHFQFADLNLTTYPIDCIKQSSITNENWHDMPQKSNFKFGIIVPNFNYEHTLEKCLRSILDQTYTNYQIIFVDDVSTDRSKEIAKELLKAPHKIVELKQKRFNGGARNEGYLYLDDDVDYVYYVDSDDWLYSNYVLEKINNKLQTKPDVLFVGMADYKGQDIKICYTPKYADRYEAMKGWSGSCGKVIKKSLATKQECLYNEGTLKEDKNQHYKICINMNSFAVLPEPVYVWNRANNKSVTTIRDEILWGTSTIRHYADTLQLYLTYKGKDAKLDRLLEDRVNKTKAEMNTGGDRQW